MIRLPNHFSDHWIIVENTIVVIKNNKNYFNKKNIMANHWDFNNNY